MTEVETTAAPAPAPKRLTSAGIIQAEIAALPSGASISLAELHKAVTRHEHLASKTATEVYNDTQSLASRGKIGRGVVKQTWCKLEDQNNDARTAAKEAAKAAKPASTRVKSTGTAATPEAKQYSDEEVLTVVVDALREPVEQREEGGPTVVLDGRMSGADVLAAVTASLGGAPTAYSIGNNGPNVALSFYRD